MSFSIKAPKAIMKFVALKGSIAVDGISLTIQNRTASDFKVAVIPHTFKQTTFGMKKAGDFVNLEIDLITRYLNCFSEIQPGRTARLKISYLKKQGF